MGRREDFPTGLKGWVGDERGFEERIILARRGVCSKKTDTKEFVRR